MHTEVCSAHGRCSVKALITLRTSSCGGGAQRGLHQRQLVKGPGCQVTQIPQQSQILTITIPHARHRSRHAFAMPLSFGPMDR